MLMDTFIKQKDFKKAALVSHEIMLQELGENELTLSACLFSCVACLKECNDDLETNEDENDQNESEKRVGRFFLN